MKKITSLLLAILLITLPFMLTACNTTDTGYGWRNKYNISMPNLVDATMDKDNPNKDGWYMTLNDDFNDNKPSKNFMPVENVLRKTEYWCESYVDYKDGKAVVSARREQNHNCANPNCAGKGKSACFTSGLISVDTSSGSRGPVLFEQAFGYYEARVKVPNSDGMWSAFWLQTNSIRQLGNKGKDGSEIDIYESSFFNHKSTVGSCIHYDGYQIEHRSRGGKHDTGINIYEGYHTFALKWTPYEYVFYCDGKATWATNFGEICRVPAFIMLTNEIRNEGVYGPYGQKLGKFTGGEFLIDYVKVYQNVNYLKFVKSPKDFK